MNRSIRLIGIIILLTAVLAGCVAPATPHVPTILTVMTHDSFAASQPVIDAFEQANNVKISFLKSGDAGAALNRAILSKNSPLADVFYGVDNSFLSRAVAADIFQTYQSPALKDIPTQFQMDTTHQLTPIDYGDVCINYDKTYFADKNLALPQSLEDLTKPEYKGLLVVTNPAISSPGLAFELATIAHFGEAGAWSYWMALRDNGLVVVNSWETAYYTNFSGSTGKGTQPMALSYGTSPAAEVVFASTPLTESPTASLVGKDMCFRQVEFAGILKGTHQQSLAKKFIDFMLSTQFQEDMPLQMFVFPVNPQAKLPEAFQKYVQIPAQPASLDAALISANRDGWIQKWSEIVLK